MGPTRQRAKCNFRHNHSPLVVPWAEPKEKAGDGVVEWGRAWGWNGEECVQGMQPEPKGTIQQQQQNYVSCSPRETLKEGGSGRRQGGGSEWE